MNPESQVIKSPENGLKYVVFSKGWDGLPLAYHLQLEGCEVLVGQIQDDKELGTSHGKEEPDEKKQRLSQYDGMLKKYPARKLCDALKKVKNKDEYFIICDQNNLFVYGQELLDAGFTQGLFPTEDDFNLEKEREGAMKFVEENYPKVQIIPHQKFETVEEARVHVEEVDYPLVIQSEGDYVSTICPVDDVEQNHIEILAALDKHEKDYAKGQIILKEKLVKPVEVTPQIVFYDGAPIYTSIDIETKNIGDGENNGNQVGCGTNLIIATSLDEKINEIAFPPKVYEMASERKGIFVWDISLYFTEKGIFFGEFCSNRFGYDASMTEMSMSGGVKAYFEGLMNGTNPMKSKFGTAVRVFNLNRQEDQQVVIGNDEYTYLYEVKKDDDKLVSVGTAWDLGVITGCGETFNEAVDDVYENLETLTFKEKYTRTKADFLADYPTSIARRYITTNHFMFEAPDMENAPEGSDVYNQKLSIVEENMRSEYESKHLEEKKEHQNEITKIRSEIESILNEN